MTTRIEIKNEGPSNVVVSPMPISKTELTTIGEGEILAPGATISKYVWQEMTIVIHEE